MTPDTAPARPARAVLSTVRTELMFPGDPPLVLKKLDGGLKRHVLNNDGTRKAGRPVISKAAYADISRTDLAKRCGVHITYVTKVLRGVHNPSLRVAMSMAREIGVTVEELFKAIKKAAKDGGKSVPVSVSVPVKTAGKQSTKRKTKTKTKTKTKDERNLGAHE